MIAKRRQRDPAVCRAPASGSARRWLAFLAAGALTTLAGLVLASPTLAENSSGGCGMIASMQITPNSYFGFAPGYTMNGNLTNCQWNTPGPASGAIGQGQTYTESVPITEPDGTVVQGTAQYQQSQGYAGTCGTFGGFSGDWIINWPDATNTVISANASTPKGGPVVVWGGLFGGTTVESGTNLNEVPGTENPAGTAPGNYFVSSDNPDFPPGTPTSATLTFVSRNQPRCFTAGVEPGPASLTGTLDLGVNTG